MIGMENLRERRVRSAGADAAGDHHRNAPDRCRPSGRCSLVFVTVAIATALLGFINSTMFSTDCGEEIGGQGFDVRLGIRLRGARAGRGGCAVGDRGWRPFAAAVTAGSTNCVSRNCAQPAIISSRITLTAGGVDSSASSRDTTTTPPHLAGGNVTVEKSAFVTGRAHPGPPNRRRRRWSAPTPKCSGDFAQPGDGPVTRAAARSAANASARGRRGDMDCPRAVERRRQRRRRLLEQRHIQRAG